MPGKNKIGSKCKSVDVLTKKSEVIFDKECKRLLGLGDEIGTKGDNKHAKCEDKARLKHEYYWIHKEEDTIFNGMKAVYKILSNKDNVTMKHFYHIRCDPDLDEGFCAMRRIPCACTGCVEKISKPWLSNLDKNQQPRCVIEPETCKYSSILHGYNKWYIA